MSEVEWVDVVDLNDIVVGAVPRPALRTSALHHRVVHVFVVNRRGELLLQRPAAAKAAAFQFGSSVAGQVRQGESYEMAAIREYREELGVEPPPFVQLAKTWLDLEDRRKFIGVFACSSDGPFVPDPGEVSALEWMRVPDVRRLLLASPGLFSATFARVFRQVDLEAAWPSEG